MIALTLAPGDFLSATTPVGKSSSIDVTITNTGNVTASGPLDLTLSPSSDGVSPVASLTLAQIDPKHVHIAPGKSMKLKLQFKVTAATTAGTYFPYLSVSLAGVTQTAVGSAQFTIWVRTGFRRPRRAENASATSSRRPGFRSAVEFVDGPAPWTLVHRIRDGVRSCYSRTLRGASR